MHVLSLRTAQRFYSNATAQMIPGAALHSVNRLVAREPVVVFIKGTPEHPRCKHSKQLVELLERASLTQYAYVDTLEASESREAVKCVSAWDLLPQVFADGEFVGGLEAIEELQEHQRLRSVLRRALA
ncbi:MAG: uncharacterized protein KVP18_002432 [Porospora cf. gigantea A]|uniref:uncharacterized protein n=1 Tax=Porospora cf. gigantea A TaxID=2853593 RepID=UPI00355A1B10|nr:MAG: hypothetical protein KVP18_002432 [Porospora cf. gigantea A]